MEEFATMSKASSKRSILIDFADKQLLVHEKTAQALGNAIAIAITLTLPRLLVLFQLCLPSLGQALHCMSQISRFRLDRERRLTSHLLETFLRADSISNVASRLIGTHLGMRRIRLGVRHRDFLLRCREMGMNFREDKLGFGVVCMILLALLAFYVCVQAIAIMTLGILSGNLGVPASPACGLWLPAKATDKMTVIATQEESRAVAYAKHTYSVAPSSCSLDGTFVTQNIQYQESRGHDCPFAPEHCLNHASAIILDSGMQSARILGLNSVEQYSFRKKITCAPLRSQRSSGSAPNGPDRISSLHNAGGQLDRARYGEPYDLMRVVDDEICDRNGYLHRYGNPSAQGEHQPTNLKENSIYI